MDSRGATASATAHGFRFLSSTSDGAARLTTPAPGFHLANSSAVSNITRHHRKRFFIAMLAAAQFRDGRGVPRIANQW